VYFANGQTDRTLVPYMTESVNELDSMSISNPVQFRPLIRGRLHMSDSAFESPYDSVHDLHTNGFRVPIIPRSPITTA
jgi:hypothetical protein